MGYSLPKIKEELAKEYNLDEELVSWGAMQYIGGAKSVFSNRYQYLSFCLTNKKLTIIPFTDNKILYNQAKEFDSKDIKRITFKNDLAGLLMAKSLYLELKDGNAMKCSIMRNSCKDMTRMIDKLRV